MLIHLKEILYSMFSVTPLKERRAALCTDDNVNMMSCAELWVGDTFATFKVGILRVFFVFS